MALSDVCGLFKSFYDAFSLSKFCTASGILLTLLLCILNSCTDVSKSSILLPWMGLIDSAWFSVKWMFSNIILNIKELIQGWWQAIIERSYSMKIKQRNIAIPWLSFL